MSEDETDIKNCFLKECHEFLILLPAELFPQRSKHGKHSFTRLPLGLLNFCCMRCYCVQLVELRIDNRKVVLKCCFGSVLSKPRTRLTCQL